VVKRVGRIVKLKFKRVGRIIPLRLLHGRKGKIKAGKRAW